MKFTLNEAVMLLPSSFKTPAFRPEPVIRLGTHVLSEVLGIFTLTSMLPSDLTYIFLCSFTAKEQKYLHLNRIWVFFQILLKEKKIKLWKGSKKKKSINKFFRAWEKKVKQKVDKIHSLYMKTYLSLWFYTTFFPATFHHDQNHSFKQSVLSSLPCARQHSLKALTPGRPNKMLHNNSPYCHHGIKIDLGHDISHLSFSQFRIIWMRKSQVRNSLPLHFRQTQYQHSKSEPQYF